MSSVETSDTISYINEIPFDLKENILSLVDDPLHLLSLALSSKEWAELVIPNHLDYRILHVRWPGTQPVWDHLALRADLAKNIRSFKFMAYASKPATERIPRCVSEANSAQNHDTFGTGMVLKIIEALRNFKSLKTFTWVGYRGHSLYSEPIFTALHALTNLNELHLVQMSYPVDALTPDSPILKMSNLQKLTLHGQTYANFSEVQPAFVQFINQSPNLRELTISCSPITPLFTSCTLSCLRKLHLYLEAAMPGNVMSTDEAILSFIGCHPLIEDLEWYPRDDALELPQGLLPNLKRLFTKDRIAKVLLNDDSTASTRKLEAISQISLGPNTVNLLRRIDGSYIQELHLWRFDDLDQICELAVLFPKIKAIDVPNIIQGGRNTIEDVIDTLARFKMLEQYLDSSLWLVIHTLPQTVKQEMMNKLTLACPNLRSLRHWRKSSDNVPLEVVLKKKIGEELRWIERANPDVAYAYM